MNKMGIFRLVLFFCALALLSSCDSSTEPTNDVKQGISGTVKASGSGAAISNARLFLVNIINTSALVDSTHSSTSGTYKFDNLDTGQYIVYCIHDEYYDEEKDAKVTAGANTIVNFSLDSTSKKNVAISFHIRDAATKVPLQGVTVELWGPWTGVTDANGNLDYDGNYYGDITFDITADGYTPIQRDFDNIDGNPTIYDTVDLVNPKNFLVASYYFSNNFIDSTGHGHDGTNHGVAWTADRFGNPNSAIFCDGTTDYVSVESAPALNFGKDDFTLCVWVNTSAAQTSTGNSIIIDKSAVVGGAFMGYSITYFESTYGTTSVGTTYGAMDASDLQTDKDSRWHLYTAVVDRKNGYIYIYHDGKLVHSESDTFDDLPGNITTTAKLLFGGNGSVKNAFKGKIDDIKLFNVALDGKSILDVYHENGW